MPDARRLRAPAQLEGKEPAIVADDRVGGFPIGVYLK